VFDIAANVTGADGTGSQSLGATHEIRDGLGRVKQRLQQVFAILTYLTIFF
jgi:hypothetical protein